MKDKYLIAIDLDGTLLTDAKTITSQTKQYLNDLTKLGHCVVIATGRPLRSVLVYQEHLGIDCPIVCYNGAMTLDYHHHRFDKRIVHFDRDIVKQIINDVGLENFDNLMIETESHIYLLREDEELNTFFWNNGHSIVYGSDFNFDEDPMTLIFKPRNFADLTFKKKLQHAVEKYEHFNLRFWYDSYYSEVFLSYGTKQHGLEYIAEKLGFDHKHTIACGDAENDMQMLKWAQHSIVMLNGDDKMKNHATIVTDNDNNNDGLVAALKKIIG